MPDESATLSWRQLAALPLSYGTAAGSLDAMDCKEGDTVLVRGGTSALGLTGAVMTPLLERIVGALNQGTIELPMDPTQFTLEHYEDALAFLDSKDRKGKVVVTVG